MLEVGQVFNKNGVNYCILDIFNYENSEYALLMKESEKFSFIFYRIIKTFDGYNLEEVVDQSMNFKLLEFVEKDGVINDSK